MAKAKYDVGDILTWCKDGDCYATAVIVRWHKKSMYVEGISLEQHTDYDVFVKSHEKDDFELAHAVPECAFFHYKVVGHIDISGMPNDEVKTHLDHAIKMKWYQVGIVATIEAYWAIMKPCEPKDENEYIKKEFYIPEVDDISSYCYNPANKLAEENRRLKEEIGMQSDKIFELNEKIGRIATNLRKIGFTSETIRNIIETDMV